MALRTPMKKTQFGSRDLLANGGGCPVEVKIDKIFERSIFIFCFIIKVFCRLRPPKETNNDQEVENASASVKLSGSSELTLFSAEVNQFTRSYL